MDFEIKNEDALSSQRDLFLFGRSAEELRLSAEEFDSIKLLDVADKNEDEIKAELRDIIADDGRSEHLWRLYMDFLRNQESAIINEIVSHPERSGPMVKYIDWDYVKERSRKGSFIVRAPKNAVVCDQSNLGQATYFIIQGTVKYQRRDVDGEVIREVENSPFEYFGEQAVINQKVIDSTNTVSSEEATLLSIDAETLLEAIDSQKSKLDTESILSSLEVSMPPELLDRLIEAGKINILRKFQSITTQTHQLEKVRIMLQGSAFVLRNSKKVGEIKPGGYIGDMEIFMPDNSSVGSVITSEDCIVIEIDSEKFAEMLADHKSFVLRLSQRSGDKITGMGKNSETDPFHIYNFEFEHLEGNDKIKQEILTEAREIISQIVEQNPTDVNDRELEDLFAFICSSLEKQEVDNPKHYVSHGANHSLNVSRFSDSIIQGSESLRQDIERIFGSKGTTLLRLVAVFHDIGYPDISHDKTVPKWRHQEFSAKQVEAHLPYERLSKLIPLSPEEYNLFLEAIAHHGSDNPDPEKLASGRPFILASNEKNPLLVSIRIADNLDLIEERLTKLQKDPDFVKIIEEIYHKCLPVSQNSLIEEGDKSKLRREIMVQTINFGIDAMYNTLGTTDRDSIPPEDKQHIKEISDNLQIITEIDDWRAFLHFRSVAVAQNVFIEEEPRDENGSGSEITVYIEYNQPSESMPLSLLNWQSGRLEASVRDSMSLKTADGKPMELKIRKIFPISKS